MALTYSSMLPLGTQLINFDLPNLGSDQTFDIMTWNIENFPKTNKTSFYLESIINTLNKIGRAHV